MSSSKLDSAEGLVAALLSGNRRALARAITHIENNTDFARPLLAALYPRAGSAHILGITGAPGTGKSTLVNGLAGEYRRRGCSVGIIAVDPTSPFTGGALLGDRVRMRDLAGDTGVFIRSMATRGSLGGLAQATADVVMTLDAAGFDRVIVETVGVGQSEVEIASTAHTTVVVEAPGLGDEVQAIKAGILEIADIFAVNKVDRDGADRTVMALKMMLNLGVPEKHHVMHHGRLLPVEMPEHTHDPEGEGARGRGGERAREEMPGHIPDPGVWMPPIIKTIAIQQQGIVELLDAVESHRLYLEQSGNRQLRERLRAATSLRMILRDALLEQLLEDAGSENINQIVHAVAARQVDPYTAARQLIDHFCS